MAVTVTPSCRLSLRMQIPSFNWAAQGIHELRNTVYGTVSRASQQNDREKTSLSVPWGVVAAGGPQGTSVRALAEQASYIQGTAKALHQGWRQPNAAAMLWPSLPVSLKNIFHWFLVSWASWRSYSTEFQWNLAGKVQKGSYEISPHVCDHRGDVPWLILRGNSLSKVREGRKLQDATEIQGFGKVISSSDSESHSLVLQSPLPFPDVGQTPLLIRTCLINSCLMFLVCLGFVFFDLTHDKQTKLSIVLN